MAIQLATLEDLGAVVEVVLQSIPNDPQWNYRSIYHKEYAPKIKPRLLYARFKDPLVMQSHWPFHHDSISEPPHLDSPAQWKRQLQRAYSGSLALQRQRMVTREYTRNGFSAGSNSTLSETDKRFVGTLCPCNTLTAPPQDRRAEYQQFI